MEKLKQHTWNYVYYYYSNISFSLEPKTEPRKVIHTILRTQTPASPPGPENFNLSESLHSHPPLEDEDLVNGSSTVKEMKSTSYPIICK